MNDPFYRQDIFFFITTVAVVLVTLLLAVLIGYLIKISHDIKYITKRARTESDLIAEDIGELRENIKREGVKLKFLSKFFSNLAGKRKP
jgi:hypothetical protein